MIMKSYLVALFYILNSMAWILCCNNIAWKEQNHLPSESVRTSILPLNIARSMAVMQKKRFEKKNHGYRYLNIIL